MAVMGMVVMMVLVTMVLMMAMVMRVRSLVLDGAGESGYGWC